MSTSLLRTSTGRAALLAARSLAQPSRLASLSFTRGKATLPDLPYDYSALEPAISGHIMELHHSKHHQTYVTSYNAAAEQLAAAEAKSDIAGAIALQPLLTFHGGGHLNHSLFWENLAPAAQGGGEPPKGALGEKIQETYGGVEKLQGVMEKALAGVQGSGWAWLVRDNVTGGIGVRTYAVSKERGVGRGGGWC
ncbi:aspartate--tRNA ligase msd1 [Lambiella insularis]|nr:aspartate--tRNA ligase msd1 [Lambiella insularis]